MFIDMCSKDLFYFYKGGDGLIIIKGSFDLVEIVYIVCYM